MQTIPPLHPMREVRGTYEDIRAAESSAPAQGEYVRIVLTDRRPEPEIYSYFHSLLESRNSILMELVSEYQPFRGQSFPPAAQAAERAVEDLFMDFYKDRFGGAAPDEQEQALLRFVGGQVRQSALGDDALERQAEELRKFALKQESGV